MCTEEVSGKGCAIEVGCEGVRQCFGRQWIDDRKAAEAAETAELRDDRLAVGDRIADEGEPVERDAAGAQSLDGEQTVVDRAEPGARADDHRDLPAREEVGVESSEEHTSELQSLMRN